MDDITRYMERRLGERAGAGNLRTLKINDAVVDFFSNDYLGIATSGILTETREGASLVHYSGSTGSRLLSGNSRAAIALEEKIAAFHNAEAALLFNSGYDANVGLISCLADRNTTIIYDELCHASIIDGARLALCARKYKFGHNDTGELETLLKKNRDNGAIIVITESIFSMDGDMSPLLRIADLCDAYGAKLIVDEAHATGVFGRQGRGLVCALGLEERVFARVHTFGKALGCHGAVVVGSALLQRYLVNFARTFIYTTALPGHSIVTVDRAYDHLACPLFDNGPLHELIGYFRTRAANSYGEWSDSGSPIQVFMTGSNERGALLSAALRQAGMRVSPIAHPTVPLGLERLRICLHAFNTKEQVDVLFKIIQENDASS